MRRGGRQAQRVRGAPPVPGGTDHRAPSAQRPLQLGPLAGRPRGRYQRHRVGGAGHRQGPRTQLEADAGGLVQGHRHRDEGSSAAPSRRPRTPPGRRRRRRCRAGAARAARPAAGPSRRRARTARRRTPRRWRPTAPRCRRGSTRRGPPAPRCPARPARASRDIRRRVTRAPARYADSRPSRVRPWRTSPRPSAAYTRRLSGGERRLGGPGQLEEPTEGDLHALPDPVAESSFQGSRVGWDGDGDRGDDLLHDVGQPRSQHVTDLCWHG